MTITYFLTGSYHNVDHDFELIIHIRDVGLESSAHQYAVTLKDSASENGLSWQSKQDSFFLCLKDMDEFVKENNIILYSKILTSSRRDKTIDKELEGFIIERIEF